MTCHLVVIIKNAHVVVTLTFIMTENFPIPLRMLYHIPETRQQDRRGKGGVNILNEVKLTF